MVVVAVLNQITTRPVTLPQLWKLFTSNGNSWRSKTSVCNAPADTPKVKEDKEETPQVDLNKFENEITGGQIKVLTDNSEKEGMCKSFLNLGVCGWNARFSDQNKETETEEEKEKEKHNEDTPCHRKHIFLLNYKGEPKYFLCVKGFLLSNFESMKKIAIKLDKEKGKNRAVVRSNTEENKMLHTESRLRREVRTQNAQGLLGDTSGLTPLEGAKLFASVKEMMQ